MKAVTNFTKPKTIAELRRFLGMFNFYRRCLPHAAETQASLNNFLSDSRKNDKRVIPWNPEAEKAFEKVKLDLTNATLLAHPSHKGETRLVTDASDFGMGASLEQRFEDN